MFTQIHTVDEVDEHDDHPGPPLVKKESSIMQIDLPTYPSPPLKLKPILT